MSSQSIPSSLSTPVSHVITMAAEPQAAPTSCFSLRNTTILHYTGAVASGAALYGVGKGIEAFFELVIGVSQVGRVILGACGAGLMGLGLYRLSHRKSIQVQEVPATPSVSPEMTRRRMSVCRAYAHDSQSPLAAIKARAEEIGEMQIIAWTEYLIQLRQRMLDFSRLESGTFKMEKSSFILGNLLTTTRDIIQLKAKEKGLLLSFEYDEVFSNLAVAGDEVLLKNVLLNLLGNAVKFTHKGSVTLSSKILRIYSQHYVVEFSITDTGIGLKPEEVAKLFQPFTQANASIKREYGGTGLGLSICEESVALMNLEYKELGYEKMGIHVKSIFGKGTTFSFCIALKKSIERAPQLSPESSSLFPKCHILIVEDSLPNQKLLCRHLEALGCQEGNIKIASDGKEALQILRRERRDFFDLILMDKSMPNMDGISATQQIRTEDLTAAHIIGVTATTAPEDIEQCLAAGMQRVIRKGLRRHSLKREIGVALSTPIASRTPSRSPTLASGEERKERGHLSQWPASFPVSSTERV